MRVFLGGDHATFELTERLLKVLAGPGYETIDCGAEEYEPDDDYPSFCLAVGEADRHDPGSLGVVLGGSGNGEQIAANKVPDIRAVMVRNRDTAILACQHNDANVLAVGARHHSTDEATELILPFPRDTVQLRGTAHAPHRPDRRLRAESARTGRGSPPTPTHAGHRAAIDERKLIGGSCPNIACLASTRDRAAGQACASSASQVSEAS